MKTAMKKPKRLTAGDRIAVIAPSSPVDHEKLKLALESIEFLQLTPVLYPSCTLSHGYLAGTDIQRAMDVNNSFQDGSIDGIFCVRGGYGASRILPQIDLEIVNANPKVFLGYSDITALHILFNQACRLITFHGPMPSTGYATLDPYTLRWLTSSLFSGQGAVQIEQPKGFQTRTIFPGEASGIITGGNLSLLVSTLGSPYEIDTKGKILFLEETEEQPYKIDKSLTALALAGKFDDCAGIILGTWSDCTPSEDDPAGFLTLAEVFDEVVRPYRKPTINNFRSGHVYPQITIPMGIKVKLDATSGVVSFLECGTRPTA